MVAKKIGIKIYSKNPQMTLDATTVKRSLDMTSMLAKEFVYVKMVTADDFIRGLYDGWYRHNENHTALINDSGLVLPYTGLKHAYNAYAYAGKSEGREEE